MHAALTRDVYLVRERLLLLRGRNDFDILDPETGRPVLICREPNMGLLTAWFRLANAKQVTPFEFVVTSPDGQRLMALRRGLTFLRSVVEIRDGSGLKIGGFRQRLFSIGGKFDVQDAQGVTQCMIEGSWTGWEFRFTKDDRELARVTKTWSGIGRELFTTADSYVLSISPELPKDSPLRMLILGSVVVIDMVYKE